MSLPWHLPLETLESFTKKRKCPEPNILKHFCNLDIHENPSEELQTALMCDIGAHNLEPMTIQRLIAAGMDIARINVRDMEPEARGQLIQSIRQAVYNYSAELEYVYPLALIVDVHGPDILTGFLKGGPRTTIELLPDQPLRLTTDTSWRECGVSDCLYIGWDHLTDLLPGDLIFIDTMAAGRARLKVSEVGDDSIECIVETGGTIGSQMTVRISLIPRENELRERGDSQGSVTCVSTTSQQTFEYIEQQLAWAAGSDVDAVLIPATQTAHDIRLMKDAIGDKGKHILMFACIDTVLGLNNIDEILSEADGIYLDRGILTTDLPVEKIFIAQKVLLAKCKAIGKPCICKAVINEQVPTLCVADIANLILDGVDVLSLELHYDSPLKKLAPGQDMVRMAEQCLAAVAVISRNAERTEWMPCMYGNTELMQSPLNEPTKALCVSAIELAMRSNAVVIICLTSSGKTAKTLSHISSACPVVAVTRACHTSRQLRFWRGVRSVHYFEVAKANWAVEVESRVRAALDYCKAKRIVHAGDPYVILTGSRRGVGYCDSIRLLYASARDTVPVE